MSAAEKRMQAKISTLKRDIKSDEGKQSTSSSSNRRGLTSSGLGGEDTESMVGGLKKRVNTLETDLKRRQETYLSREQTDTTRIRVLEQQLEKATSERKSWMKEDKRVSLLKNMHSKIMKNIDHVQGTTARILQEQERDLLRAFRARLFDVQAELEKERSNKDDGSAALIEKNRQYEKDLDWAKEMADRLERVNQAMGKENSRLKSQFKTQQDDREFLIKELVTVRKDNERLRQEVTRLRSTLQDRDQEIKAKDVKMSSRMAPMSVSTPILPAANRNGAGAVVSIILSDMTSDIIPISSLFFLGIFLRFYFYSFLICFQIL
jgi:chromosome segregation ATPase